MYNNTEKFYNITQMCKTFGALCKRAFYSIITYKVDDKLRRFKSLENSLNTMMSEYMYDPSSNILDIHYDYILDGKEHWTNNIASLSIVIMYKDDLLVYDIFADVLYILDGDDKELLYINNKLIKFNENINVEHQFTGNMHCESLQLIYYLRHMIENITPMTEKIRPAFEKFAKLKISRNEE